MSAEITNFTATTMLANYSEILAYLQANATDYFTSIAGDDDNHTITCNVGETAKLVLNFNSSNTFQSTGYTVYLENGTSYQARLSVIGKAVKTSCGIMLFMRDDYTLTITKNNENTTVLIADAYINPSGGSGLAAYDFLNSLAQTSVGGTTNSAAGLHSLVSAKAGHTTPVPFCFDGTTYTENAVLLLFNNLNNVACRINIDGEAYVCDGAVALKE